MKSQHVTARRIKPVAKRRAQRVRQLETLEARQMMASDFRPIDGVGNNLLNPQWGSTDETFLRTAPAEYADGIDDPAGANRPSARAISSAIAAHPEESILNDRDMSAFVYVWGQFIDHDIDLTPTTDSPQEETPIAVPTGDAYFDPQATGTKTIGLTRSLYDAATGTDANNARQQVNAITAFIDGSQIYGSDVETAQSLRTLAGGRMKTSAGNLLPTDDSGFFIAGDIRVNENPGLLAIQTLFVREHNRLADSFAAQHPEWNDEEIYQQTRRIVVAEVQAITFNEFLPALLGRDAIAPYHGYNPQVNPGIANEFAAAAFRLGHSLLGDEVEFLDNSGAAIREPLALRDAFFNTQWIGETDIGPVLKYIASDRAEELDVQVIDDVRNFLFGPPGAGGFDLASLNIQRGRDHGLADYNAVRVAYGLPRVTDFAQVTANVALQDELRAMYGSVDEIDLWVGGLAEDHVPGASVGPLFQRLVSDQFTRLRDGDRFWYERDLSPQELKMVRETSLADVIRANSTASNLQENVFFFKPTVSGQIYLDRNTNGQLDPRETGLGGIAIELRNEANEVVATTQTNRNGKYVLEATDLGNYTVNVSVLRGLSVTSNSPVALQITSGERLEHVDFGIGKPRTAPPRPDAPPPAKPTPPPPTGSNQHNNRPAPPPPPMLDPQMVDLLFGGSSSGQKNNKPAGPPR
ncbi:MAG TPA: peroxidase family protein [Pirellulaceae bacterium]|nr:peroxidase family protein [Pirellulaceae bacterium]